MVFVSHFTSYNYLSSILAWRIPWTEEPGRLPSIGSQSQTRLKRLSLHAGRVSSVQFSRSVMLTLCNPMDCSTPDLPVHHQLLEFTQTHLSRYQGLFKRVSSSHQVAKILEFQLHSLELLVAEDYMIVYLNGATPRRRMPGIGWLKKCYQMIDRR